MSLADFVHILNPSQKNRAFVAQYFSEKSVDAFWVERTSHPTHLETLAEWALLHGKSKIALWGGDGSLSRLVDVLHRLGGLNEVTVGLVPAGTCNDFAKVFRLRLEKDAIEEYFTASWETLPIDVGLLQFNGRERTFINNSGFGREPRALKIHRSNPLQDIAAFTAKSLRVVSKTGSREAAEKIEVFFGIIFNAPYFNGGMHFKKDLSPSDGRLAAVFVPPQAKMKLLLKLLKARWGKPVLDPLDLWLNMQVLTVDSSADLYPQVDGEAISLEPQRHLRYSLLSEKLNFLAPLFKEA